MSAPESLDEAFLTAMIEGAIEPRPWSTFAQLLRIRFAGIYGGVILRRPDSSDAMEVRDFVDIAADHYQRYHGLYKAKDPIRYHSMGAGKAYVLEDFCQHAQDRDFVESYMRPSGIGPYMICRVEEEAGFQAWLIVMRSASSTAFDAADRDLLEQVARLFGSAFRLYAALKRQTLEREVHQRATQSMAVGVLILDHRGEVMEFDDAAQRQLHGRHDLRIVKRRLHLDDRLLDREFQGHLKRLLVEPLGRRAPNVTMNLGDSGMGLMICPLETGIDYSATSAPRLAVYLSQDMEIGLEDTDRIAALFRLTRREGALAALLAAGLTIAEAADELGISEGTARTYSKRLFFKTGVRRQPELVRRILTSVMRLSSDPKPTPATAQ